MPPSAFRVKICLALICLLFAPPFAPPLYADDLLPAEMLDNTEVAAWRRDSGDGNFAALLLGGYWNWTLTGSLGWTRTSLGWQSASVPPLLFVQEADVRLEARFLDRWFVEGRFVEEAKLNSYRAGYRGKSGEFIKYIGVGNTGLDFPSFPYLNLGGNSPASIGAYTRLGGGNLQLHALFRYDDAAREERIFVGGRERYQSYKEAREYYRGISFVLPEENLSAQPEVYLEDKDGALRGSDGRRYRKAGASEAAVSARFGLVELSKPNEGRVVVVVDGGQGVVDSLGEYNGSGYLAKAQAYFGAGVNLARYPQPGGGNGKPGFIQIEGRDALVIYEKGAFSPFERLSRYEAPSNDTASAYLVDAATDDPAGGFTLDLYREEESIDITDAEFETAFAGRLYELRQTGRGADLRAPASLWPLAQTDAAIYLPGGADAGAYRLKFISFGAVGGYRIGTDVIEDSVQVTRGGLADTAFTFSAADGVVRLERPAMFNETIRISYLRLSSGRKAGSIAGGAGFTGEWIFERGRNSDLGAQNPEAENEGGIEEIGILTAGAGLGARWNVAEGAYSEGESLSPGQAGFGGTVAWAGRNLNAALRLGASYGAEDTTGLYRIAGMEGREQVFNIANAEAEASSVPEHEGAASAESAAALGVLSLANRAELTYRDYTGKDFLNSGELLSIENDKPVVSGKNVPYPARDGALGSAALVLETKFEDGKIWAGWTAKMPEAFLDGAREIEIPYRFYRNEGEGAVALYAQFGELAVKDGATLDNAALTITKRIYPPADIPAGASWKAEVDANITLSYQGGIYLASWKPDDAERQRLRASGAMRIIAVKTGGSAAGAASAALPLRLITAQPVVRGAAFVPLAVAAEGGIPAAPGGMSGTSGVEVTAVEVPDASLQRRYNEIDRLHPDGTRQRILTVEWNTEGAAPPPVAAGAGGRLGALPFSAYRRFGFFLRIPNTASISHFEITLATGAAGYADNARRYFRAAIPAAELANAADWVKVEVVYGASKDADEGVYVEGRRIGGIEWGGRGIYARQTQETAEYPYLIFLARHDGGALPVKGAFSVDEVMLTESDDAFTGNLGFSAAWQKPGTLIAARGFPLVGNVRLQTDGELFMAARGLNTGEVSRPAEGGAAASANAGVELAGFQIKTEAFFASFPDPGSENSFSWKAGHSISRFFGTAGLEERFSFDPEKNEWLHGASVFLKGKIAAELIAESREESDFVRDWKAKFALSGVPAFSALAGLVYTSPAGGAGDGSNYAVKWADTWRFFAPDSGADAAKRRFNMALGFNPERAVFWKPKKDAGSGTAGGIGLALLLDGSSDYSQALASSAQTNNAELAVPFNFWGNRAVFSIKRRFERNLNRETTGIGGDLDLFAKALASAAPLYAQVPFYALFDPNGAERFTERLLNGAEDGVLVTNSLFRDEYNLGFRFAPAHPLIPRQTDAYIRRDITRKLETTAGSLVTGASVRHNAVNIAGAFSSLALFPFYQTDEIESELSAELTVPDGGETTWRVKSSQSVFFYGFRGAELEFEDALTFRDSGYSLFFALYWTAPNEKSLAGFLYELALKRLGGENASVWTVFSMLRQRRHERLRREKLEFTLSEADNYRTLQVSAYHESIVRISGSFTFKLFAGFDFSHAEKSETLSIVLSLGTALNVSW